MKVFRADRVQGKFVVKKTDEGFLQITAPIAKVGVMTYLDSKGKPYREYVPEETLFNKDDIETFQLKPVTNDHPPEMVMSTNSDTYAIGSVGQNMLRDGELLAVQFTVTNQDAIDDIESGKVELSPGYECVSEATPGITPNGEKYDTIQRNRKYNHLAIVDKARGGSSIKISMDGSDVEVHTSIVNFDKSEKILKSNFNFQGDSQMKGKVTVNGISYPVDSLEVVNHVDSLAETNTQLSKQVSEHTDTIAKLKAQTDTLNAEIKKLKEDMEGEEFYKRVDARTSLLDMASKVLGKDLDKKDSNDELMIKIIEKEQGAVRANLDSMPETERKVYLSARYDSVASIISKKKDHAQDVQHQYLEMHNDSANGNIGTTAKPFNMDAAISEIATAAFYGEDE